MLKILLAGLTASISTAAYAQAETFSPLPNVLDCKMKVFGTFDVTDQSGESIEDIQDRDAFITEIGSNRYLTVLQEDGSTGYVGRIEDGKRIFFGGMGITFHRDSQNLFWFFEFIEEVEGRDAPRVMTGRITC